MTSYWILYENIIYPRMFKCSTACMCAQSCATLCGPMDCTPPGSSVHEIFQTRILEWVAISSSRGSFQLRDRTHISCLLHWQVHSLLPASPGKPKCLTAAKSLQSCLTLCDPVPGVLQVRTLEWGAISLSNA